MFLQHKSLGFILLLIILVPMRTIDLDTYFYRGEVDIHFSTMNFSAMFNIIK